MRECGLPAVVKPCVDCPGTHHRPSGKFRVNANGKLLDVWLLLCCAACGRTSKVPVHERVHVQSLKPARRLAYENNDAAVVRELTMSASLAARNAYRLDWTGTWRLETDMPFYSPLDPQSLTVLVAFELPVPVRVELLLMRGLGLSRGEARRMVAHGRIRLPLAVDAKVHRDFEFTVDGAEPALIRPSDAVRPRRPQRRRSASRRRRSTPPSRSARRRRAGLGRASRGRGASAARADRVRRDPRAQRAPPERPRSARGRSGRRGGSSATRAGQPLEQVSAGAGVDEPLAVKPKVVFAPGAIEPL